MAIKFDYERTVPAPPERVFAAMTDLDELARWMPGFVGIERLTEGPMAVGTQFRETRKVFGMQSTEHFEVVGLVPARELDFRVDGTKGTSGKGVYRFRYRLGPDADGTRLRLEGEIGGISGLMAFFAKLMMGSFKKACTRDLDALADYLQAETTR